MQQCREKRPMGGLIFLCNPKLIARVHIVGLFIPFLRILIMDLLNQILDILYQHTYTTRPGFILEHFGNRTLRNVFLSESALSGIENSVVKNIDVKLLYQTGKEFGYNYAKMIPLPRFDPLLGEKIFENVMRFFETTYGKCNSHKIDWNNSRFEIRGKDVIVCRKNGLGTLAFVGGWAGLIAYLCNNKKIEGIQPKCQGRSDEECIGVFAPADKLEGDVITHPDFAEKEFDARYIGFNRVIPFKSDYGLDLLESVGIVKYQVNTFDVGHERFFPTELTFLYSLEKKLKDRNADVRKIIYDPTFEAFEIFGRVNLQHKYSKGFDALDFTSKLFSAFGWGIIQVVTSEKPQIFIKGFPWTPEIEDIRMSQYFLGSIDGLISGLIGRKCTSEITSISKTNGTYDVILTLDVEHLEKTKANQG